MTSPAVIAQVKASIDLAALVSDYVPLKKAAARYVGLCPFHKERTPSFGVHPQQWYKCFGCGAHGDCFCFLQRIEGIPFSEALKRLAERTGVSLDDRRPVSRAALAYAREQAEMCRWWWERRRDVLIRHGMLALEDGDSELTTQLYFIRERWDALSVTEKYRVFREQVRDKDYRAWQGREDRIKAVWGIFCALAKGKTARHDLESPVDISLREVNTR